MCGWGADIEGQVTSREHSRPAPLLYIDTKSVATKLLSWYFIAQPPLPPRTSFYSILNVVMEKVGSVAFLH
jgi:hypothetical protein